MADQSNQSYASSDSREDSNGEDSSKSQSGNVFRNDGSFMEMFKKLQEDQKKKEDEPKSTVSVSRGEGEDEGATHSSAGKEQPKKSTISFVGKRRGGRILATGMVKKQRKEAEGKKKQPEGGKTDAWSQYMNEVRKYKEQSCEEEGKRRPLVK